MNKKAQRRLLIIAGAGLILVVLGSLGRLGAVGGAVGVVVSPISQTFHNIGVSISSNLGVVGGARNLAADNARLTKENADLRAALATTTAQASELTAIKRELGLRESAGKKLIPADVTSTQPDSYRAYITINRGTSDGVQPGMVVVSDGTLVGTVSQASSISARVVLATDPSFRVTGQVLSGGEGAIGTVRGNIGGGLVMEKIPQDQTIKVGDTVITSGLGGGIVKGYSIGTIQSVNRADNGVFQSAVVRTPVQIGRLQTVFVVAN